MTQNTPKEMKIIFTFEALDKDLIKCDIKEKLINIFKNYSKKKGIELDSLYFLCNGEIINDFEKTFEELANVENKNNMEINILVYIKNESKIDEDSIINVYFLEEKKTKRIKCKRKDKIKDICNNYEIQTNFKSNSMIYKYKGIELDLEKSFDNYELINNDIFIKVCSKTLIYIIFAYFGILYNVECYKEDKIEDMCSDFASKNNINKKKVMFKYKDKLIEQNKTLNQFLNENNININEIKIDVIDFHGFPSFLSIHKIKIIVIASIVAASVTITVPIIVSKNGHTTVPTTIPTSIPNTFPTTEPSNIPNTISTTIPTIIYSTFPTTSPTTEPSNIPITAYTTVPTIVSKTILESSTIKYSDIPTTEPEATELPIICEPGYALIDNECLIDYFIKAIYFSEAYERIQLISNNFNLNKIQKMTIDGIITEPTKFYTFNESGQHIIYYSFVRFTNNSLLSMDEGSGIFSWIEKLLYVEFSNYSANNSRYDLYHEKYKYYPDVRFYGMFNNCINLKSVDLSNLSIFFGLDVRLGGMEEYYLSGYFNSLDYMFNNCTSLNSLNFSFLNIFTFGYDTLKFKCSKFMFNNCISLTSIDLSKLGFTCIEQFDLNNMFSNCISLKTLILFDFYCDNIHINMSYMFYNCSSLTSLDFPSSSMNLPEDMSYSFAFCSSLKEFVLELAWNEENPKSMSNAFRNCTSLVSIDLLFITEYEDMSYLFMGCTSLTHIDGYFDLSYAKYMNNMFYDCNSLQSVDIFETPNYNYCPPLWPFCYLNSRNLIDVSKMFSGCSSLTSIDLSRFITRNIKNYEDIFYNCKKLSYIDISSFEHNNLPSSNLSIFDDNYPFNTTIIINEDFSKRIKIPLNSTIIIKDNIYKGPL